MNNAYQFTFECPKGGHKISLQRRSVEMNLSESDVKKMLVGQDISCCEHNCGWRGKASRLKLLQITPFQWIV